MKNNVKRILLLLLTVVGLIGCCVTVSAADVSWSVSGTDYKLMVDGKAATGYYEVGQQSVGNVTFAQGYYFVQNGKITAKAAPEVYTGSIALLNGKTVVVAAQSAKTTDGKTAVAANVTKANGLVNGKVYKDGSLYTGIAYTDHATSGGSLAAKVTNGVINWSAVYTGIVNEYFNADLSVFRNSGAYFVNGKQANGLYDFKFYKNGRVDATKTQWFKANGKLYYVNRGTMLRNTWAALPSYGGGSTRYGYYFENDGSVRTNFFGLTQNVGNQTAYRYYLQKVNYVDVNRTSHTVTYYATVTIGGAKVRAPLFSCICSTSRSAKGTKLGTFFMTKTSARKWFIYKKSNPYHYYQYGVMLKGSPSWFHSTMYATKNASKLVKPTSGSGYNYLGTNQTTACIRVQAAVAKLNYDIARDYKVTGVTKKKQRVYVHVFKSAAAGPFGTITLGMTTGKIDAGTRIDPSDPALRFGGNNQAAIRTLTPKFY